MRLDHAERVMLAAVAVVVCAPIVFWLLRPPLPVFAGEVVAVLIAVVGTFALLNHDDADKWHSFKERIVVFLAVMGSVGVAAIAAERIGPTAFDTATITVKPAEGVGNEADDEREVPGGYVTSTDYAVLVLPTDEACPMIKAVPRDQILRIVVSHADVDTPDC